MTSQGLALVDVLAQIHDPRQSSGKRYSLVAILALAIAAMLCGYKSYSAIAEWGRHYGQKLAQALGFTDGKTPCAATFYNIFSRLDKQVVEQQLGAWAEGLLQQSSVADECEAIAIDGKSLRASKKQGAPAAHLLSALGHRLGLTLLQMGVADKTNEITAIQELLRGLMVKDRVITVDALLTRREVAQTILAQGGD
jgi:DDE_Tnp_1-associated